MLQLVRGEETCSEAEGVALLKHIQCTPACVPSAVEGSTPDGAGIIHQLQGDPHLGTFSASGGDASGKGKALLRQLHGNGAKLPTTPPRSVGQAEGRGSGGTVARSPMMSPTKESSAACASEPASPAANMWGKAAGKGESRSKIRASAAAARATPEVLKTLEACSPWSASTAACTEGTDAEESAGGGVGGSGAGRNRRRGAHRRMGERPVATTGANGGSAQASCGTQTEGRTTAAGAQPRVARRGARRARGRSGSTTKYQ